MKKIITILVLFLTIFAINQVVLAGPIDSCEQCCEAVGATMNQNTCKQACNQTIGSASAKMTACQASCDAITTAEADKSLCKACCTSLGYVYSSPLTTYGQISKLIISFTRWFAAIVFAIAVIMIIYGGVLYITAAGSEDKAKTAKKLLIYACIGIAVAILAFGAQFLIQSFLESGQPGGQPPGIQIKSGI